MKVKDLILEVDEIVKKAEEDGECTCDVCELYDLAKDKYKAIAAEAVDVPMVFADAMRVIPECPKCGKLLNPGTMYGYLSGVVGGSNTVDENENIQMCQFWSCPDCEQNYAMMPEQITWNANHDIHFTGGAHYLTDEDEELAKELIFSKISASVDQFCEHVRKPKDGMDEALSSWNLRLWIERDITAGLAEYLYSKGLRKIGGSIMRAIESISLEDRILKKEEAQITTDKWIESKLIEYPNARKDVLQFIYNITSWDGDIYITGYTDTCLIMDVFAHGYCYYFAKILEDAFGGALYWHKKRNHILWGDNGVYYDSYGIYERHTRHIVSISELGDDIEYFRHRIFKEKEELYHGNNIK